MTTTLLEVSVEGELTGLIAERASGHVDAFGSEFVVDSIFIWGIVNPACDASKVAQFGKRTRKHHMKNHPRCHVGSWIPGPQRS